MSELLRRLLSFLRGVRFDRDLDEEMRFHLEMQAEENRATGMRGDEAEYAARRQFGNVTLSKERSREVWGWTWIETLLQDLRYALRTMRRNPGYAAVAVLSLALGTGANTAIFSLLDTILLRSLPVRNPGELVFVHRVDRRESVSRFSYPDVKRFPFVPRDEFWGQRNGTQLSFPQLAGSRLIGPSGAEQAWFDDLPVASLHRLPVTKPDWNDDVSKRWATRQEASEVSDPSDGRRPSGLRTSRSSLNKCLVQTRSAIPQREIKTGSETDGCISCLLICGLSGSSALRRFLSLDGRSPHKC